MGDPCLPPEVAIDLHIHLDNLRRAEERCREGLRELAVGHVSRDDYLKFLERHEAAHEAWTRRYRKYFVGSP